MSASPPFTGGCLCGAVRYESTAAPIGMMRCHCRDCQRASGGAYVPVVLFPIAAFRFTRGEPRRWKSPSTAGGNHVRGFCGDCGARLTGGQSDAEERPFIGVVASSLDDPSIFKPAVDIFVSHIQPWDNSLDDAPRFDQYPPM